MRIATKTILSTTLMLAMTQSLIAQDIGFVTEDQLKNEEPHIVLPKVEKVRKHVEISRVEEQGIVAFEEELPKAPLLTESLETTTEDRSSEWDLISFNEETQECEIPEELLSYAEMTHEELCELYQKRQRLVSMKVEALEPIGIKEIETIGLKEIDIKVEPIHIAGQTSELDTEVVEINDETKPSYNELVQAYCKQGEKIKELETSVTESTSDLSQVSSALLAMTDMMSQQMQMMQMQMQMFNMIPYFANSTYHDAAATYAMAQGIATGMRYASTLNLMNPAMAGLTTVNNVTDNSVYNATYPSGPNSVYPLSYNFDTASVGNGPRLANWNSGYPQRTVATAPVNSSSESDIEVNTQATEEVEEVATLKK
jgi:hypothetical protein